MLETSIGTIIWTSIAFLAAIFILGKFGWKPILQSIKERENFIAESLEDAKKAKLELERLKEQNEELINEARAERDQMLKEAREARDKMISEAKGRAKSEADQLISNAREAINNEKMAALTELKNEVATLSIDIAEKIIKEQLSDKEKQQALVNNLLEEVNLN